MHFALHHHQMPSENDENLMNHPSMLRRSSLMRRLSGRLPGFSTIAMGPPVIDLHKPTDHVRDEISRACSDYGFFQVVNHGVEPALLAAFREQMVTFFNLPAHKKGKLRRDGSNARGFFDDELTKRRRDWKEALDFGVPGSRDWGVKDNDPANVCLDGFNRFPSVADAPLFRDVMVRYFESLTVLSATIAARMAEGLDMNSSYFDDLLHTSHTSYLRLNYYPPCQEPGPPPPLGISPHKDAGFLTVLEQDLDCHSLQVVRRGDDPNDEGAWVTMVPIEGALTINTGDMAQIWSNDRYHAPLHRVLTHPTSRRYSAPFFYNPGYDTKVAPLPTLGEPVFHPCTWGYYRAQRFAGDFADFGTEIQSSDYLRDSGSPHLERQRSFLVAANFARPFSVDEYRPLLTMPCSRA